MIRRARPDEAADLGALAVRSKAAWGYSPSFMAACRAELTYTPAFVREHPVYVADLDDAIVGFYALCPSPSGEIELDALFVAPERMRTGVGRALLAHALATARGRGAARVVVQSDPHAEPFYAAAGAVRIGERASRSLAGRELPLLRLDTGG